MSSNSPVGKLGQGGGTNPNLLINSNKKINQRGLDRASVLDGEYHVDRWMRDPAGDKQFVEYQGPGGDVTLSWTGGGTGYINGVSGQSPITASVPEDTNIAVIVPEDANYSKLESGSYATPWCLAGGVSEIALCHRYYWQLKTSGAQEERIWLQPIATTGTNYRFANIRFPQYMRVAPTVLAKESDGSALNTNFIHEGGCQLDDTVGGTSNLSRCTEIEADAEIHS